MIIFIPKDHIIILAGKLDLIVVLKIDRGEFPINYQSLSKELKLIDYFTISVSWLINNILCNSLIYFLKFDIVFTPCDIWAASVTSIALYLLFRNLLLRS